VCASGWARNLGRDDLPTQYDRDRTGNCNSFRPRVATANSDGIKMPRPRRGLWPEGWCGWLRPSLATARALGRSRACGGGEPARGKPTECANRLRKHYVALLPACGTKPELSKKNTQEAPEAICVPRTRLPSAATPRNGCNVRA